MLTQSWKQDCMRSQLTGMRALERRTSEWTSCYYELVSREPQRAFAVCPCGDLLPAAETPCHRSSHPCLPANGHTFRNSPTHWQSCERMRAPLLPSARVRLALSNAPKRSIPQRSAGTRDLLKKERSSPSGPEGIVPAAEHVGYYVADPGDMRRE